MVLVGLLRSGNGIGSNYIYSWNQGDYALEIVVLPTAILTVNDVGDRL